MPNADYGSTAHDGDYSTGVSLTELAYRGVVAVASLKLTVTLLSLGIILVFFGTMAQIDQDVWPVVDAYFRSFYVWIPFQLVADFGKVFFELPSTTKWKGSFPFPGGHIIGGLMLINLLAAHAIRFKVTWKRSGVLLIHAGLIMLMVGELITGQLAVESRMTLQIGETANFIDVSRRYELALATSLDDKTNEVIIVPDDVLIGNKGKTIRDNRLPVDIEVIEYWPNTTFETNIVKDDKKNRSATVWPGDSGLVSLQGIYLKVVPSKQESGVESSKDNAAGFRLRFKLKGTDDVIGEHFISQLHYRNFHNRAFFATPKIIYADGKSYQLTLRNKREEKPYSLHMLKFEHGVHERTNKAKDYSSTVELFDPRSDEKRELKIYMNNPLRHDGVTFYQAGFVPDDSGTVLQVVRNPGWLLLYLACITVSLGMLIHFGLHLSTFMRRQRTKSSVINDHQNDGSLGAAIFPWAMLGIAVLYLASKAMPPRIGPEDYNLPSADSIPILDDGRIKPLDSLASVSLMSISNRSEFEDADEKMKPAIVWLLDVMSGPSPLTGPAADHKVFRIENDQVLNFLGLESRPGSYRYSIREILMPASKFVKVKREFDRVSQINSKKQTLYEQKIADLSRKVRVYTELNARNATVIPPQAEGEQWQSLPEIDEKICKPMQMQIMMQVNAEVSKRRPQILKEIQEAKFQEMEARGTDWKALTEEQKKEIQQELSERLDRAVEQERREAMADLTAEYANQHRKEMSPAAEAFSQMLRSWEAARTWQNRPQDKRRKADAEEDLKKQNRLTEDFNKDLADYKNKYLKLVPEEEAAKTVHEVLYNRLAPFYHCAALFILAFMLGCASWIGWTQPLSRASTYVCLLALTVHSLAMFARIYLQGRPPVTNLYSSALFIGWGCVGVCLILERFYQNGMGNVVGSFMGFATMIVAHHLGMGKDTLEKLEAVLDTNFWLATHVTAVTLGYSATFIAGFIGVVYIVRGVFTKSLDPSSSKALSSMLYGILCFATLLSFVGTVLGGIWADQSWGRFWGWDPKENGAVLIVLWNSLILHARWSGLVRQRGVAVLALVGNMITVWSWFGTNQLGAGLHAYGFDSTLARGCRYAWLAHLALIGIGLLPLKFWRSFNDETVRERAEQAKARLKKEGNA